MYIDKLIELRPPRIAQSLVVLALVLQFILPGQSSVMFGNPVLALVTGLLGLAVMLLAWNQFRCAETAICPTEREACLIINGIYQLSRNPMYLGMTMMMLAVAILTGSIVFYLAALLFFLIINQYFCPYEETKLIARFGEEYICYAQTVRRWL